MTFFKNILFLPIVIFGPMTFLVPTFSQSQYMQFEKLTVAEGLSQGFVTSLLQDQDGFIWIGTKNGLNRYDGRNFKTYTHDPFNSTSLSANWILSIKEYEDFLVLGLEGKGVDVFDKKTGKSWALCPDNELDILSSSTIGEIFIDKDGLFWVRALDRKKGWALLKITLPTDWKQKNWEGKIHVQCDVFDPIGFKEDLIVSFDSDGKYGWFSESEKLQKIDLADQHIISYDAPIFKNQLFVTETDLFKNHVWAHDDENVFRFDDERWHQTHFQKIIQKIEFISDQQKLLVKKPEELLVFNLQDFLNPNLEEEDAKVIIPYQKEIPTSFLMDRSGILWVGTNGYGIRKYNPRSQQFHQSFTGESVNTNILLGSNGQVCNTKNENSFRSSYFPSIGQLVDDGFLVQHLITDESNTQWALGLGKKEGSVSLFKEVKTSYWKQETKFLFPGDVHQVQFIVDQEGCPVIVYGRILQKYHPQSGRTEQFDFSGLTDEKLISYDMKQTPDGQLWIATQNGLIQVTPDEEGYDFAIHNVDANNPDGLHSNFVTSLLPDPKQEDILWIGTNGGGLNCINVTTHEFDYFTEIKNFPDNVIYGILADDSGELWMSSNKGIITFDPSTGKVRNYREEHGLPTNEFNSRAFAKALDGTMYFGCVEGLISFHPKDFTTNLVTPKVRITKLEVNNHEVVIGDSSRILQKTIEYTNEIRLDYTQNNINLELAALELSIPGRNVFKYYLEGTELPWVHHTSEPTVTYLNLSPGNYTFKVKASNSDDVWSDQITSLNIIIQPPWYLTNIAYLVYIIVFLLLVFGAFQVIMYRQQLNHKLELEQKEAERLKELDEFKSNLYTNITHEFRTPLTVIKGMADQIEEQPEKWMGKGLHMIRRNANSLLQLVNQILELRKLQSNVYSINNVNGDVVKYIRYIIESFHSYAQSYGLDFHFQSDMETCQMDYDPEKLMGIISNLLSNAVKYTPQRGSIYLRLKYGGAKGHDKQPTLIIEIQDTGQGIPADELPLIFDRFYQSSHSVTHADSSGIGLSLVKELVKLAGGRIDVNSEVGKGTTFTIHLPIENTIVNKEAPIYKPVPTNMLNQPKNEAKPDINNQTVNPNLPSLLVIEDNNDVAQYLLLCVENEYRVKHVINGEIGIETAIKEVPDIIISDVMMPIKDGFEVVNTLKNDERTSHIPIILLTAKTDDTSRIKGLERGADAYLSKPFNKTELLVRLRKLLELRQKLQQRYATFPILLPNAAVSVATAKTGHFEDHFMLKLQQSLEAHLSNENFGVKELCQTMGMSRTQLHHKIKALTGKSTSLYIRSFRLRTARQLLVNSDRNISEIAADVGFKYLQHFSKYYFDEFGEQPSKTRPG